MKTLELDPSFARVYWLLGLIYEQKGNFTEAEKILNELLADEREKYIAPDSIAMIYAALGDKEKAFFYLEKAIKECPFSMFQLAIEQRFDEIRDDSRFQKIQLFAR